MKNAAAFRRLTAFLSELRTSSAGLSPGLLPRYLGLPWGMRLQQGRLFLWFRAAWELSWSCLPSPRFGRRSGTLAGSMWAEWTFRVSQAEVLPELWLSSP